MEEVCSIFDMDMIDSTRSDLIISCRIGVLHYGGKCGTHVDIPMTIDWLGQTNFKEEGEYT